ncbi:hypothetical protein P4639_21940 [Priestia megaterium]|uniref:hypothetical protein n=1 Tax=Priestia megaterium TaxID=1404 RepID=UPI002E1E66E1|nr:hypothetical protein [Priestia megaterium]
MTYTAEIKDEQGNVVSTFPVSPAGGDKLNTIILDKELNMRQQFPLNSMQEVRDFEIFWRDERDIAKLKDILDGKKRFTDIDACSEINGYIVNLEFKNGISDIQSAIAQLVKAVREAMYNSTFTFFAISSGDVDDIEFIVPVSPFTIEKIRNDNPEDLQWLIQKSNKEHFSNIVKGLEEWTLKEENLREDDAFEIAKKIQNAVHIYNMNN